MDRATVKKWLKKLPLFLIPLFGIFWFTKTEPPTSSSVAEISLGREIASVSKTVTDKKFIRPDTIIVSEPEKENLAPLDRTPQSLQSDFQEDPSIVVSKGNEFITNVGAITKEDYSPKMGPIIHEHMGLVFFKTESNHNYIPVALNRMTNALYPISSIIHLKGVNEALRNNILGQGYSEYYYQQRIQFLSIKSEPSNIMKDYSDLRQKGYDVQLEVLTPHHKTFN
jgi:hypothetical protein